MQVTELLHSGHRKQLLGFSSAVMGIFLMCLGMAGSLQAQQTARRDTSNADSMALVEFQLSQNFSQRKIDSLVKVRLQQELDSVGNNTTRAKELEAELMRIRQADTLRKHQQVERLDALRKGGQAFPVVPFEDTLFYVHVKLGSSMPAERAEQIAERIRRLYDNNLFSPDSLQVAKTDWGHEVMYRPNETILIVSELDALWYERDSYGLSTEYRNKIVQAIQAERKANSLTNWLKRIGLVLLIIVGAVLLVRLISSGFEWLVKLLHRKRRLWFRGITLGKAQILSPAYQGVLVIRLIKIIRLITIIIALYLCLPLLFRVFPGTEEITSTLLGWVIAPAKQVLHSIVNFLPNLFTILVIWFFTNAAIKGLRFLAGEVETGRISFAGFHPEFARPTYGIARFVLYAFMLVVMFPYLPGSGSPAFQGVSVFLGVLLSLGSSSAINNVIAGLVITYMRPFQVGDRIRIGDLSGDVIEKTMLVIKLRTIKNEEITVPNSTILSSNTINYSAQAKAHGLILHTTITIGYDVPWRKMEQTMVQAALRCTDVLREPAPFVWQTSLDDFYVSYQLNVFIQAAGRMGGIQSELHKHIQDCCREAGIEIMSPHYRANRSGDASTIPES